jgi:hypothetical protein
VVYRDAFTDAGRPRRCLTEAETEVASGLEAAQLAADATAFAADAAAAEEAWGKWTASRAATAGGQPATMEPFSYANQWFTGASRTTDPRTAELYRRTGHDQLIRHAYQGGPLVWGDLSPGANARVMIRLRMSMCETDSDNTRWLKAQIAEHGWWRISSHGEGADNAAWLMVQHADRDPEFQAEVLGLLETLLPSGDTAKSSYAYLFDRVAVGADRPQRYGTQGGCVARNRWEPDEIEDPDRVEALRAEVDVGSLAEYPAHMHQYCANF